MSTELVNVLLKAGIVTQKDVNNALKHKSGVTVVENLLSSGCGCEDDVYKVIKNKLKLAVIEPDKLANIPKDILAVVPRELVEKYHFIPFYADAASVHIAMLDPTADPCLNEVCFFTSKRIVPYGVMANVLSRALNKYYGLGLPENFQHGEENFGVSKKDMPPIPAMKREEKRPPLPISKPMTGTTPPRDIPVPTQLPKDPKDAIVFSVLADMRNIAKRCIVMFLKYSDLICDNGFGEYIDEKLNGYTIPLNAPSIFMSAYDTKIPFHGIPISNYLTDEFYKALGGIKPKVISVVPVIMEGEVFAMIYAEEVSDLDTVKKVSEKMSREFERLLDQ